MHLVSKDAMKIGYCTFPRWSRGSLSNSCSNWGSEISRPNLWRRSEVGQYEVTGVTKARAPTREGQSVQQASSIRQSLTLSHTAGSGGSKGQLPSSPGHHTEMDIHRPVDQGIRLHIHVCTPSNIHLDKLQPSLAPETTDKDKLTYQMLWIKCENVLQTWQTCSRLIYV